ncbi:hypothetical protein RJ640_018363 [Escallonia rubra]|uniref:GAG-pre-integrase domain-containing protein n=1 Tax=Escallonia rubra TaxID=112253 RepID=A0AA88RQL3_9ASTE|nr:hypothetical protein RJ640_018363 [Escallonia rubra]
MFVLQTLFDLSLVQPYPLFDLIISFFGNMLNFKLKIRKVVMPETAAHILGLLHDCYLPCDTAAQNTNQIIKHSAVDLDRAGVDFKEGRIKGKGTIGKEPHSIENVLYVEGLKHNLLSISQFSDKGFKVIFEASQCTILSLKNNETILVGSRDNNVYSIQLNDLANQDVKCLSAISETSWLWHRRLGHMHMEHLKDISSKELVRGLPKIKFEKDKVCDACQMVYNKSTLVVEESINVTFDETNPFLRRTNIVNVDDMDNDLRTLDISDTLQGNPKEIDLGEQPSRSQEENEEAINDASNLDNSQELPKDWTYKKDHPSDQILGNPSSGEFEMSMMGELTFFLGLQIKQSKDGIFINQAKYTKELLKRFDMEASNAFDTPMSSSLKLDKDEKGKDVDIKRYRGMIGSLLYLTASRPDIMFSVCLCARFQACPKESHLIAVKRILRYLKGTHDLGLWFPRNTSFFDLIGYSDADYAGCKTERKSTSGGCQFLGHSLVSWSSKKQNSVALSTTEAEYMAVGACCAQILWMKQTLLDFGLNPLSESASVVGAGLAIPAAQSGFMAMAEVLKKAT